MSHRRIKVLIIGQTPPPYTGQAIMIEVLLKNPLTGIRQKHIRMAYSRDVRDIGRITLSKFGRLASLILRSVWALVTFKPDVVYYPPAGPNVVPVLRDLATLLVIRPLCRSIVFHFHAGGISELWTSDLRFPGLRFLFRKAFFGVDAAIAVAKSNPPDGQKLAARRVYCIPHGIEDVALDVHSSSRTDAGRSTTVLFVGVIAESKGVLDLVDACRKLWHEGYRFDLSLVGPCTMEMRRRIRQRSAPFHDFVILPGVLTGSDKWARFANADIFCYPSFFEAETFGVACLEAMVFGLPVVATRWRGLQDLVVDAETGYLVPTQDAIALADRLGRLLRDPALRNRLGERGRRRYEELFTLDRFLERMTMVFHEVSTVAKR
jgi:glycosyltransferase involved in cell wall biosynthesis